MSAGTTVLPQYERQHKGSGENFQNDPHGDTSLKYG